MSNPLAVALVSCAVLGLRHGFDYDHLAAITDITSVQRGWRQGMGLGLLYALGHALTVAVLGIAVMFLHLPIPAGLDAVGERLVGATLMVLAVYVVWTFFRRGEASHAHIPVSRIALLVSGFQTAVWWLLRPFRPDSARPETFRFRYDRSSVFGIGIIHGLGAETPSQLLLFLLAANLGGISRGMLGLGCFLIGLLVMNTAMTASASGVFATSVARPRVQAAVTGLAAVYSFAIGLVFVLGTSDRLPALVH